MTSKEFKNKFDELYLPLCMYALRITSDREESEDIVQQAFAYTCERLGDDEEIASIKSYLYRAVHNLAITRMRRLARTDQMNEDIEMAGEVTEEEIDTSERDAILWREIGKLPDRCREVFLMSKRDGYTNREIAEELGISEKTVENQMTKAYSRLRESLMPAGRRVFFLPFL